MGWAGAGGRVGEGGSEGGGFYSLEEPLTHGPEKTNTGVFRLNMGTRGRLIDHVDSFPDAFRQLALRVRAAPRRLR